LLASFDAAAAAAAAAGSEPHSAAPAGFGGAAAAAGGAEGADAAALDALTEEATEEATPAIERRWRDPRRRARASSALVIAGGKVIAGESVLGSAGVADFFETGASVGTGTEPGSADLANLSVRLRLSSGSGGIGVALAVTASLGASLGASLAGRAAGGVGSEAEPRDGFVGFRALSVPPAAPAEYPAAVVDASLVPALFAGSPVTATEETRLDDAGAFAGAFESPSRRRVGGGGSLDFGFASRRALLFSRAADFPSTLSERSASASTPSALDSLRSEGEGGGGIFDFRRLARDLSRTDAAPYAATVSARSGVSRSTPECSERTARSV